MIKLFGKGQEESPIGKGAIPTDRVTDLTGKGFSEPEIIDVLRKEGYGAEEIDRALTQALKIGITGGPEGPAGLPTLESIQTQQTQPFVAPPQPTMPQMPERSLTYPQQSQTGGYGTEELVESIVHERMNEVDQKLNEFRAKYADLERNITDLHHQLSVLSKGRSDAEEKILNKIDSFKETLNDLNSKVSSLDKAFKDALPALIESVRSLSDLVHRLKKQA
jgi:archaellum component FlaC